MPPELIVLWVPEMGTTYEVPLFHSSLLYLPASQLVHFEDPTSLTVPSAHNVQVAAVRPTTLEYLPASQLTHEDELLTTLYVPASQIVHEEEPLTLKVPAGQVVHIGTGSPTPLEYMPGGHASMHVAVLRPTTLENLPASQLVHVD